jgi:hypothetical protein
LKIPWHKMLPLAFTLQRLCSFAGWLVAAT